jgi:hypothetical protein
MTDETCRACESETRLSKITVLLVRYTTQSDPISELTKRLDHEPEEKNIPGNPKSAFQRDSKIVGSLKPSKKISTKS